MDKLTENITPTTQPASAWGFEPEFAVCESCDWRYLYPKGKPPKICPHCFRSTLTTLESAAVESSPDGDQPSTGQTQADAATRLPYSGPPELYLPFTLSETGLAQRIEQFARGIPFPPADLTARNLSARLQRVFLPMWLVDAQVRATWQAEAGYDYQVVSHQDRFDENRGGWTSQEVKEGRVRWEPRLGRLERTYSNLPAPALEGHAAWLSRLGQFPQLPVAEAGRYQDREPADVLVRLPDRTQQDAWPEALPAFQEAAKEECRQASKADHIREFLWSPEFDSHYWSLLLLPVLTTYYLDDDQVPQPVYFHGQTGTVSGSRRASFQRARRVSLAILLAAVAIFFISLLLFAAAALLPPLLGIGGLGMLLAVFVGLGALVPLGMAWHFNRYKKQM